MGRWQFPSLNVYGKTHVLQRKEKKKKKNDDLLPLWLKRLFPQCFAQGSRVPVLQTLDLALNKPIQQGLSPTNELYQFVCFQFLTMWTMHTYDPSYYCIWVIVSTFWCWKWQLPPHILKPMSTQDTGYVSLEVWDYKQHMRTSQACKA